MKTPQRAVIYVRISDDKSGTAAGVARQEADARALAERLGWSVLKVVPENDTSAYKRKRVLLPSGRYELRVIRPAFRHVLDLLESGDADGLIAYDLDRTARDPRDLEDLIDVVEARTPHVPVESVTGSLRLANDADVTMARVMVAMANKSSRDTGRRISRKIEALAQEGKYAGGGARRYGYERDGTTVREDEAAVIREAAVRVKLGESITAICRDFDERLILPVKAQSWSSQTLIGILRSARIAGLREHKGEIVGPAAWPAIIDVETREQVLGRLHENSHGRGKSALRYWLNGLLECGLCGNKLSGAWVAADRHRYWCLKSKAHPEGCGRIGIAGLQTEAEIARQVLDYLHRPDVAKVLTAASTSVAIEETRRLLDEDEAALRALARAHGNKQISMVEWLEARAPIEARLRSYEGALRAVVPDRARRVIEAKDRSGAWAALAPAGKRELARVVLEGAGFRAWAVDPADLTKPRAFDPARLRLVSDEEAT